MAPYIDHLEKMLGSILVVSWDSPPIFIEQVWKEHRDLLEYLANKTERS